MTTPPSPDVPITPAWINGRDVVGDDTIDVGSPYDGHLVGRVPALGRERLESAAETAAGLAASGPLPLAQRAEILDEAARLLADRHTSFESLMVAEAAKPLSAAAAEVGRAIDTLRFSAAAARTLHDRTVSVDAAAAGANKVAFIRRVPKGPVLAITPFNFPLNMVCHKVGPAIAAGCPIVLKPASATPLTALALGQLLHDAGLPAGWLNVVTCRGDAANVLVDHPAFAMITFTGSPEPAGHNPPGCPVQISVGFHDHGSVVAQFERHGHLGGALADRPPNIGYAGQSCVSVQRVLVHRDVATRFTTLLLAQVRALRCGDPADPTTDVSALITRAATDRVQVMIDQAIGAGATVLAGGMLRPDGIIEPTVVDGITPTMDLWRREVFGPVIGLSTYDDFAQAVADANDTVFGLQAGIFTGSLDRALQASAALRYGAVTVNEIPTWRVDNMPYGGRGESGNTREGPEFAIEEMTERRLVVLHSPPLAG